MTLTPIATENDRPSPSQRYFALDSVRATAMLLGVVYHTMIFRMFLGGPPAGPMGPGAAAPSQWLQDWLHSFRMPLFFLISGFFGRMMLRKYGTRSYLRKRWSRIGIPLVVGMFTFGPAYVLTREAVSQGPMGPPPAGAFPPGGPPAFGGPMPPSPAGFPPPPPGGRPGGPMPGPFGPAAGGLSVRLFGSAERLFELHHLWFLWYLLLFATVAPFVTRVADGLARRIAPDAIDRLGLRLLRTGLAPLLLAVIAAPSLMTTSGPFGWSLGLSPSIFRAFPDFLLHLDPEMGFYFAFFLAGWWLHRERDGLPSLARAWTPNLLFGLAAFAASTVLSARYSARADMPSYTLIRAVAYTLYSYASAATSFAFVGVFQRHLDRPSRTWRYLAETALWVYLVHQPLVLAGLALFVPLRLPWWLLTALVSTLSALTALLLYELLVRPTPLMRIFGPATPARASRARNLPTLDSTSMNSCKSGDLRSGRLSPDREFQQKTQS